MGSHRDWDDEFSVIGEKPEVEFLDFEENKSLHDFNPYEENPVVVTIPFPFVDGKPQFTFVGETCADTISILNNTEDEVELWSVRIFSSNPENSFQLSVMKPPLSNDDEEAKLEFLGLTCLDDLTIQPGCKLTFWLSCKPREMGLHTSIIHFDIGSEKIERVAFLLADDNISRPLIPSKPYNRPNMRRQEKLDQSMYVPGSRPTRQHAYGFKYKLPKYDIPLEIRELVECKQIPEVLSEELSTENYAKFFSSLLVMEEIHLEEQMRAYDMENVCMKRRGNSFLSLEVPGLAERRPSLVSGDFIFVKLVTSGNTDNGKHPYQGFIHRVEADEVFLKFHELVHQHHRDRYRYNVHFMYNRLNMKRLYHAVHNVLKLGPGLLFPCQVAYRRVIKGTSFTPLNEKLNHEQVMAVRKILGCNGVPPYVIYGPPGTGKTKTLVEAILQLYLTRKRARVLVCASSNSAADHILEKLLDEDQAVIRESEVFRLNAPSRPYEDVRPDFMRFCFFDNMVFSCPPCKALLRYKIIISTYISSGLLLGEGIRAGHFSHIFLDEAGQASEPETMVPISNLSAGDTVVVLAGDPKQLGPIIFSKTARKLGLGRSYLERLFESELYTTGNENYVMKLVRNYRCHPAILELPSTLFYGGELISCKEDNDASLSIYDSFGIPNKSFPLLFVGIQGCDEREGNNPSWFNRIEVSKVVEIIRKLTMCTELCEADIGVITPYRQQVVKIKRALETLDMMELKVGSVEQFQGQEREVIIVSTVRSTVKHNEFDKTFSLGFLSNFQRFNVAITRARSVLIIVGNPHIITKDSNWDRLLRYCADNGSYQGCPLPPPEAQGGPHYPSLSDAQNWEYASHGNNFSSTSGVSQEAGQPWLVDEIVWEDATPDHAAVHNCDVTDDILRQSSGDYEAGLEVDGPSVPVHEVTRQEDVPDQQHHTEAWQRDGPASESLNNKNMPDQQLYTETRRHEKPAMAPIDNKGPTLQEVPNQERHAEALQHNRPRSESRNSRRAIWQEVPDQQHNTEARQQGQPARESCNNKDADEDISRRWMDEYSHITPTGWDD